MMNNSVAGKFSVQRMLAYGTREREREIDSSMSVELANQQLTCSFSGKKHVENCRGGTNNPNDAVTLTEGLSGRNAFGQEEKAPPLWLLQ